MEEQQKPTTVVRYEGDPHKSLALQTVSKGLFASGMFPNAKNEFGAFAITQYGYELGVGPMVSLKNINIIKGQLACNSQLILTLAIRAGVTYKVISETDKGCTIEFRRGELVYTSTFDESDAKLAGLLGKDNWKTYPKDMYFWRAVAKGARRVAPDAVMGLYTADEITSGEVIVLDENSNGTDSRPDIPANIEASAGTTETQSGSTQNGQDEAQAAFAAQQKERIDEIRELVKAFPKELRTVAYFSQYIPISSWDQLIECTLEQLDGSISKIKDAKEKLK